MSEEKQLTKNELIWKMIKNNRYVHITSVSEISRDIIDGDLSISSADFPPELSDFTNTIGDYRIHVNDAFYGCNVEKDLLVPLGTVYIIKSIDVPKYKRSWKKGLKKELDVVRSEEELFFKENYVCLYNPDIDTLNLSDIDQLVDTVKDEYIKYINPENWPELRKKEITKLKAPEIKREKTTTLEAESWWKEYGVLELKKNRHTVVRTRTQEEYWTLSRILELNGRTMCDLPPTSVNEWETKLSVLGVSNKKKVLYGDAIATRILMYKILSLDKFCKKQGITPDLVKTINEWYEK